MLKKIVLAFLVICAFPLQAFCGEAITVVHGKVPAPTLIDLGPVGESVGDVRIWHFLGATPDGLPIMMDFIMTTTFTSDDPTELDSRMTDAVFSFGEGTGNSLVVHGIGGYPRNGSTVEVSSTLERAIIGGTGAYAGASGSVVSTHLEDGTWTHEFNLK